MTEFDASPCISKRTFVEEHTKAFHLSNTHPFDGYEGTINVGLSAIQAVSNQTNLESIQSVNKLETIENISYYQIDSSIYYMLMNELEQSYDYSISINDLQTISDIHTRKVMNDLHDYTGDFDSGDITLHNGLIDADVNEDDINNTLYLNIDSRGLVVEHDTH